MALEHTMLSTLVAGLLEVRRGKGKWEYLCEGDDSVFLLENRSGGKEDCVPDCRDMQNTW